MRKARLFALVLTGLVVCGLSAQAAVTLNSPETFGDGTAAPWTSDNASVVLSEPLIGGNPGGFLQIDFNYGGPPVPLDPVIDNVVDYAGNYQSAAGGAFGLAFDFYAATEAPAVPVSVFFHSTVSGDTWSYAFTYSAAQVGTWVSYTIPISPSGAGWTGGTGTFWDDMAAVDIVGLDLEGSSGEGGTQIFGLDNWQYVVPEPSTIFMLAAAFLSLGVTFRRSLGETLGRVKSTLSKA